MTFKKIVDYHIARLKDKRPEIRLDAIKELQLIAHEDALPALRQVFENENEVMDVRKAAQEAGRIIYLRLHAGNEDR